MTKFKKIVFGFFGMYLFLVLSLAQAQDVSNPQAASAQWRPGQRIQEIYNQLNLTDDQKKQLEVNKQQHRLKMENNRRAIKIAKEALQEELMKPQLDILKVNEIHSQIKALQCQEEDDKLNSILAVRSILTPDQFTKFVALMHRHKQDK